jgi:cell division protein FtsB
MHVLALQAQLEALTARVDALEARSADPEQDADLKEDAVTQLSTTMPALTTPTRRKPKKGK